MKVGTQEHMTRKYIFETKTTKVCRRYEAGDTSWFFWFVEECIRMLKTQKMVFAGLCVAIGFLLPMAFHSVPGGGSIFLPMHIPVLLCGLLTGPLYGLLCGMLTPVVSGLLTGMPPAAILPSMLCELAVYGLVTGLLVQKNHFARPLAQTYLSLVCAMLAGRIVSGILKALIFSVGNYSFQIWMTASFVTALPGIAIQLVIVPVIIVALRKSQIFIKP